MNDPALRGIMGDSPAGQSEIDVSHFSVSPSVVVAVGPNVLNGIDLGIDLGIDDSIMPKTEDMKIPGLLAQAGSTHSVLVHLVSPSVRTPTHWVTFPMIGTQ
jgi:hypothetical protein